MRIIKAAMGLIMGVTFASGGLVGCGGEEIDEDQVGCVLEIIFSTIPNYEIGDTIVLTPCPQTELNEDGKQTVQIDGKSGGTTAVAEITGGFGGT